MLLKRFFLLFLFLNSIACYAQYTSQSRKAIRIFELGMQNMQYLKYKEAQQVLKSAIEEDSMFVEAWIVLSEADEHLQDRAGQIEALKKAIAINPTFFPRVRINLAKAYQQTMCYDEAVEQLNLFLSEKKGKAKDINETEILLKHCKFAAYAIKHPVPFNPTNLGDSINTTFDEYWPTLSADGNLLVFTALVRDWPDRNSMTGRQEDFYSTSYVNGHWTKAVPVGEPLNTNDNEGAQSITADGIRMIFTACNRREGMGRCDLYFSTREGDKWDKPYNPGPPLNTAEMETQPCFSADGRQVYFVSNRAGGKGNLDIWKSTLQPSGLWSQPVNLGDSINTPGNEQSPFLHSDGTTLYFSSDYHPGMGSFDLFVSKKDKKGRWLGAQNLGYPINTVGSEIGLIVSADGRMAMYSSDRIKEMGKDLYSFELPQAVRPTIVSYMKGLVLDAETREPLAARFELTETSSDSIIYTSTSNTVTGEFLVCLPGGKRYGLNVSKEGYLFHSEHFNIDKQGTYTKPVVHNVLLKPIKVGESVVLNNIFFNTGSAELSPESSGELEKIYNFLRKNSKVIVEIAGHTDNEGSDELNNKLSTNRAKAVVDYLLKKGIEANRISSKGYGKNKPVAPNTTSEGRALNRRTECTIIKILN